MQTCYAKVSSVCDTKVSANNIRASCYSELCLQNVTLPVEAELIKAQMDVAEILLLIFTEYSRERRNAKNMNQEKSSIEKVRVPSIGCLLCQCTAACSRLPAFSG